jgi:hypothetical protein
MSFFRDAWDSFCYCAETLFDAEFVGAAAFIVVLWASVVTLVVVLQHLAWVFGG